MRALGPLVALVLLASGCMVRHAYQLDEAALASTTALIPAEREKGGKPVLIRADAIDRASTTPVGNGKVRVVARAPSRMVTAGSVLTWVGSAVSIVGTSLFIAGFGDRNALYLTGLLLTPFAEPAMIAGTALWIVGLRRYPQEASAGSE